MLFSMIPTRWHGFIDYITGAILIALPLILGEDSSGAAFWIAPVLGLCVVIYSLVTRYEAGFLGLISMRTHLIFDFIVGLSLIAAPSMAGLTARDSWYLLVAGLVILVIVLLSKTTARKARGPLLSPNSPSVPPEALPDRRGSEP